MLQVFSPEWFAFHQDRLVCFSNTSLGRAVFGLQPRPVLSIGPGGVSYIKGIDLKRGEIICENVSKSRDPLARRLRKYGFPVWASLHFMDWLILSRQRMVPNFGFDTFYPAAGNTSNYDGEFECSVPAGASWSTLRNSTTATVSPSATAGSIGLSEYLTNTWDYLWRSVFQFDTSAIGRAAKITAASIYIYELGESFQKCWSADSNNDVVFVTFSPDTTASMAAEDYNNFGTTIWGAIPYNFTSYSPPHTLSNSCITRGGSTRLMAMMRGDCNNVSPTYVGGPNTIRYDTNFVDQAYGDPYLTVTYSYPVKVNIGDSWKDVTRIRVNIGDVWKDLSELKVNISDVWKTVF